MTSSIYLNEKGLKRFEFYLEIFSNSETLRNSMIFIREVKMTSSHCMQYELEVSKNSNLNSLWKLFSTWSYRFFSNYFSPKIKYMEIRVK